MKYNIYNITNKLCNSIINIHNPNTFEIYNFNIIYKYFKL